MGTPVPSQCKLVLKGESLRRCCSTQWLSGQGTHTPTLKWGKYMFKALPVKMVLNGQNYSQAVSNLQCPGNYKFITILTHTPTVIRHTEFERFVTRSRAGEGGVKLADPVVEFKQNLRNEGQETVKGS